MDLDPVCEYLDRSDGRLVVAVQLRGKNASDGARFRLMLRGHRGRVVVESDAVVAPRVSTVGVWTNSALIFEVDSSAIPNGAFRLELAEAGGVEQPVLVRPSTGLLASSRPEPVGDRRVQPFPAAGRQAVWLRFSSWSAGARGAWRLRNVVRDIGFAAHLRRFSWVRLARAVTRPFAPRGPIWLVGERPETARDNGRALFAHLRQARPEAAIYYVITPDSPMAANVEVSANVVAHSSWRHRFLMLHADVLANAYSIKHMLPSRWHPGAYMNQAAWRIGARRVYLKHGVHLAPEAVKRANGGYDLVATVGPGETAALAATSGYSHHLAETGLARYDNLVAGPPSDTILLMPTWRRYLVPKLFSSEESAAVPYEGSTYQRFITGLLEDQRLTAVLKEHDLNLALLPHYNLAAVLDVRAGNDRTNVLDATKADIPGLLRTCDLLVTDYSSVHFDVAYVGTPIVYAQFDRDEYDSGHGRGAWFDFRRDGFGPVTADVPSTVDAIAHYAGNGFTREDEYAARVERIFTHHDQLNCQRLAAAIDALEVRSR